MSSFLFASWSTTVKLVVNGKIYPTIHLTSNRLARDLHHKCKDGSAQLQPKCSGFGIREFPKVGAFDYAEVKKVG
uniref:Uncharacterized protein n=1 Tax=Kalanchoe fedtschenkoi TaxID=63787 RepID=A0A7N0TRY7_KALFE